MAQNAWLPEGYTIPSTSKYMKFQDGVNTFRVLSAPTVGNEYWKTLEDGKRTPIRKRMNEKINIAELEINKSGKLEMPQHFWAFVVWNYKEKAVQILEIKQKSILESIKSYTENPKWGTPTEYDITVTRSGQELNTKYLVDHDPKEPVDESILKEYKSMKINLDALFDGADPFESVETKPELKDLDEVIASFEK